MAAKVIDKEVKRDQIVAAAIQIFAKKGFNKTTINDIAAAAHIGKGTVYEYFSNKEEIIHHSFGYFIRSLELDFQEILIMEASAKEKLTLVINGLTKFLKLDTLDLLELMFDFWAEGIKNRVSKGLLYEDMRKFYHSYGKIFADIIDQGKEEGSFKKSIDSFYTASVIVGMLDGMMVQWILHKETFKIASLNKAALNIVLKGILDE